MTNLDENFPRMSVCLMFPSTPFTQQGRGKIHPELKLRVKSICACIFSIYTSPKVLQTDLSSPGVGYDIYLDYDVAIIRATSFDGPFTDTRNKIVFVVQVGGFSHSSRILL